jgi:hypothetical protein
MKPDATFTPDQVTALLNSVGGGGNQARPLPRTEPQVPFGPGIPIPPTPINPVRPDTGRAEPRQWEYPVTWNLPGFGDRLIPWGVLRDSANLIPLLRLCIEVRKDEIDTLKWDVTISEKAMGRAQQDDGLSRKDAEAALRKRVAPDIGRLVDFWEMPDKDEGLDFTAWARKWLEEYFVLDAIPIYPRMSYNGNLYGFEIIDGSTIKPLLNSRGRRPKPPQPAFQQLLYGWPRGEWVADADDDGTIRNAYAADQLVYFVHNTRTWTPYGLSAVEMALSDGDLFARRMQWLKAEYTEGSMPASWLLAGELQADWSVAQLLDYNRRLNDYLSGSTQERMRHQMLPFGMKPAEGRADQGERYQPHYDLHLIKLVAGHFATTIAELGFTEPGGLGSEGWHEGQADVQDRRATRPTLARLQKACTRLMRRYLRCPPELEFRFLGLESEDESLADDIAGRRVGSARMTLNEDRDRLGQPRYTFAEADMPFIVTGRGVVFLEDASKQAPPGTLIGPPQEPKAAPGAEQPGQENPAGAVEGSAEEDDDDEGGSKPSKTGDAVKAELVAYRRYLTRRGDRPGRPFVFHHLDKADAPSHGVDLSKAEFGGEPAPPVGKSPALARVGTRPSGGGALGTPAAPGFDWGALRAAEAGR